ncbi:PQQ-binding-like beta-propeller repeat protein [Natrinema sp. 74]|uniref:outer membrane protein assembly factor BamB family protein n=1 Tax=Natrinema sp. 74 TaxID=3384159 RepID=UPI0038D488E8
MLELLSGSIATTVAGCTTLPGPDDGDGSGNGAPGSDESTVADGVLYVGTWDKILYALDVSDGSRRWTYDAEYGISGSVAVADGTLVYGDDYGNIVALAEQ